MILPLAGLALGAALGAAQAWRRGGKKQDIAQWAIVFALIGGMIGLFALIFISRSTI